MCNNFRESMCCADGGILGFWDWAAELKGLDSSSAGGLLRLEKSRAAELTRLENSTGIEELIKVPRPSFSQASSKRGPF
jgi:hypothetical protein